MAKKAQATTLAIARPPGIQPTRFTANLMMRLATPPSVRKAPASTKNGTAMMAKLSRPVNRRCEMMFTVTMSNEEKNSMNTSTVIPRAMEMGVPVMSMRVRMPMMRAAVIEHPLSGRLHAYRKPARPRQSGRYAGILPGTG